MDNSHPQTLSCQETTTRRLASEVQHLEIDEEPRLTEPVFSRSSTESSVESNSHSNATVLTPTNRLNFLFKDQRESSGDDSRSYIRPTAPLTSGEREARLAYARQHSVPASALYTTPEGTHVKVGERWSLLRWEDLKAFLMDEENTRMLDDNDIIKQTAIGLRAQNHPGPN